MGQLRDLAKRQLHANDLKISALLKENAALKAKVASLRINQQPQPAMCLGCEYWKLPSQGHCMRGEGTEFCVKVGTHAGVR
jgi:hypothetical protein